MGVTRPPLEYLATCSKVALESFELSRLSEASNLRKEVQQILQGWIDTEVDVRLARWILESKQAQARDGLQASMAQPVPLEQLDLSFLPLPPNGGRTSDGEAEEDEAKSNGRKPRRAGRAVLLSAAGRTPKENQNRLEKKPAKLVGRVVGGRGVGCSAPAQPAGKPPFAQDEENALHALERFVQCAPGASCARSQNFRAAGNSQILDAGRGLVGCGADRSRSDATGVHAEVRVFPSTNALPDSLRRAHPFRPIAIPVPEPAVPAAAAHR